MHEPASNQYDVVVIGAGMSGLAATRSLAESGLSVLILEAQQRVGGRILTVHHGSEVIELGAEFIHGRPEDLWSLLQEANLETYERTGDFLQTEAGGHLTSESEDDPRDPIEALTTYTGPDQSFADYISHLNLCPEDQAEAIAYVEGFNAADAREASILALGRQQIAEDAIEGDRVWRVLGGYDQLPNYLRTRVEAAGGTLLLGARVIEIDWSKHDVLIRTDTQAFRAAKAVITLPLGILQSAALQSNTVRFTPQPEALQAAANMRMGHAHRVTLLFKRRLWPEEMSFLIARTAMPPVWWTAHPSASLTITGWVGGPRTAQLATLTQEELIQTACAALALALNLSAEEVQAELADLWTHNWSADPHTQGAYSWVPVNGIAASSTLSQPVEDTLYFAGEHTDTTGHWGTVHAALRTGIRAANQILESLR